MPEALLRQQAEEKERQKFNQHEQADARACVEAERDAAERIRLSRKSGRFWIREMTFLIKSTAAMMPFQEKRFPEKSPWS